jgi:hypothetical protein
MENFVPFVFRYFMEIDITEIKLSQNVVVGKTCIETTFFGDRRGGSA